MASVSREMVAKIQLRNDISTEWRTVNPVLLPGEIGVETDTNLFKIGNGNTTWNDLNYGAAPAVRFNNPPGTFSWEHPVGTLAIVNGGRVFVLISATIGNAVWVELITPNDIDDAMFKSVFATNTNADNGYVDKSVEATMLSSQRSFSIAGDVIAPNVNFNGTENVILQAALAEILTMPGTFTKVIVDTCGRVIGSEILVPSDIPHLTLEHITDAGTAAAMNTGTAAGQVVVVGAGGYIDPSIMPAISITDVYVVETKEELLALDGVTQGDVAVVRSLVQTFILMQAPSDVASNWKEIQVPLNGIQLINGDAGPHVTLTTDNINEGDNNLYHTPERVVATMTTQASTILTDGANILRDSDILILNGGNAGGHE